MGSLQAIMFLMLLLLAPSIAAAFQIDVDDDNCTELTETYDYCELEAKKTCCFHLILNGDGIAYSFQSMEPTRIKAYFVFCNQKNENYTFTNFLNITKSYDYFVKDPNCPTYALLKIYNPTKETVQLLILNEHQEWNILKWVIKFFLCVAALFVYAAYRYKYCEDEFDEQLESNNIQLQEIRRAN